MTKYSTIIITALILFVGVLSFKLIDEIFEHKNSVKRNHSNQYILQNEIQQSIMRQETKLMQVGDDELVVIKDMSYRNN